MSDSQGDREGRKPQVTRTRHRYLGFLPVPALVILIAILYSTIEPSFFFEPSWLLPLANTLFVTVVFFVVSYVALRNYTATGSIQILLMGCGVLAFGIGGVVAGWARNVPGAGANLNVTIYNTGALIGAVFHFAAALVLLAGLPPQAGPTRKKARTIFCYAGIAVLMGLFSAASLKGIIPPFFVQGAGPTTLRQGVLGAADILFAFSFLIFAGSYLRNRETFLYWYSSALALTAISLTAFFIQHAVGSPIGWAGRLSQYVAGIYFLIAVITTARSAHARRVSFDRVLTASLGPGEEKFRALAENSPDIIGRFDREMKHLYLNPAGLRLYGKPVGSFLGRTIDEAALPGPYSKALKGRIQKVFETGQPATVEDYLPAEGGARFFQSHYVPEFGVDGAVANVLVLSRDLTDRKRAEEAQYYSLRRFELLAETAGDLLRAPEPQKVVDSLCRRVMDYLDCQAFFNFLVDEGAGKLRLNACAGIPEGAARLIEWLDFGVAVCGCAARDGCRIVAEHIPTTPDERTELVKSYGIKAYAAHPLIGPGGEVMGTLSFGTRTRETFSDDDLSLMKAVTDQVAVAMTRVKVEDALKTARNELEMRVTERTQELQLAYDRLMEEAGERGRLESQLRQSQKLEAVGTLAGGIAHDFNNILAAIVGFSEIARDRTPAEQPTRHHLERILFAGLRGRDLVKQILAFSRQAEQEKQPLLLSAVVKETVKLLRASLPTTIDISVGVESKSGYVLADLTQMQQIVMNLCTNAGYAMRQTGGRSAISLSDFAFSSPQDAPDPVLSPGLYVRLSISDTGDGIPAGVRDKIFDPFFTTKPQGEGTGLGLSVVHGIVASHRGAITVSSGPGKGSTFTVYLPKYGEDRPGETGDGDEAAPRGHERVLFVDDEEAVAEMGLELLEGLGYQVTAKTSGREALALLKLGSPRFDLVITDQTMPELTGLRLAEEIMAVRPDIPVILCTGFSHLVDAATARRAGIKAFVMKPLTKSELARTIRKVLDE